MARERVGRVRIGILGAAKIAPWAAVFPARRRRDAEVIAVAARDRARAESFAAEYRVTVVAHDYQSLIAHGDVDLVYIALPASHHAEWAIRALEAGKHVLCEKPFATSALEATQMVEAATRSNRILLEAIHYRFHNVILRATQWMRSGRLGAAQGAEATFVYPVPKTPDEIRWKSELGGGARLDNGCYAVHALRTLLGQEPAVLSAQSRYVHDVEAQTDAELAFGRCRASLSVALDPPSPKSHLKIICDNGALRIQNFVSPHLGCKFVVEAGGSRHIEPTDGPSTYDAQLDHVLAVLRGAAAPLTGGHDAIANMTALDAVQVAAVPADARTTRSVTTAPFQNQLP